MAIVAKSKGSGGDFTPVSEGLHPAVCWAVVDLGIQQKGGMYPGEKHEVYLGFEVLDQTIEFEKDGRKEVGPMRVGITLTNSLGEKAKLKKYLEKWRGREFTPEELEGFDITVLAGQACQVLVTHTHKGDKTYANIDAILKWAAGAPKPQPPKDVLVYALDNPKAQWDKVPKWLQEKVTERVADNWEEFNGKKGGAPTVDANTDIDRSSVPFDDDIPF